MERTAQETLDIFVEAVEEVRAAAPDVAAVGFGIPALVDAETGVSRWSTHLPLDDVPFRDLMSERLGLPVCVDNDANAALLAEYALRGGARARRHAVLVALGTGIGGGLLLDGRIYRGARGLGRRARAHRGGPATDPTARASAPGAAASRCWPRDRRSAARAGRRPRRSRTRRSAGGWRRGRRSPAAIVTELAHDGDAGGGRRAGPDRAPAGRRAWWAS